MMNWQLLDEYVQKSGVTVYSAVTASPAGFQARHYYPPERRHQWSVSKSFTSMAVGLCIQQGLFSLQTTLGQLLPRYVGIMEAAAQAESAVCSAADIKVADLLTMSSGHGQGLLSEEDRNKLSDKDYAAHYFERPLVEQPGKTHCYSSGDSYILSAIVQEATGQTLREYLYPRLFAPLGIEDVRWDTCPLGRSLGGTGLYLNAEELARFGLLLAQGGAWEGRALLPREWIDAASQSHIATIADTPDWSLGYGYQFWVCRHGAYRADGMYGQFCVVLPEKRAAFAVNAHLDDMQALLNALWEALLPQL